VRALASNAEVARVDFVLDDEVVASDGSVPFSRTIDFGADSGPRELAVIAYSGGGRELGRDGLTLGAPLRPFDLRLRRVVDAAGEAEAVAEVSVPAGRSLVRVDFFRNDALVQTLGGPPFRMPWPDGEAPPGGYLRAVARLDDGSMVEDVLMLDGTGSAERVEINLVQVFAVVTDRRGEPVEGLRKEDFRVLRQGREVDVERFERADGLPLSLGLVIDTSESMWPLMLETKQAGAEFLVDTVGERDRAFLVDFDSRPRLAQPLTGDLRSLLNRFAGLEAGGFTALYDAIVFAMLQFDQGPGRRALVVLTDGDDYRSQFTARRGVEVGQQLGVPVYFVDLSSLGRAALSGGWQSAAAGLPKLDLDGIASATGGRVYYIRELTELGEAYAEINRELRSQYLLAFSTPGNLTAEELRAIDVRVDGKGRLRVRRVVGVTPG
jgi:VWFA-related protein